MQLLPCQDISASFPCPCVIAGLEMETAFDPEAMVVLCLSATQHFAQPNIFANSFCPCEIAGLELETAFDPEAIVVLCLGATHHFAQPHIFAFISISVRSQALKWRPLLTLRR
jgi:hypothetical protein